MTYQLNTTDSSINIHINSEDATYFIGEGQDSNLVATSDFVLIMEDIISCDTEQNMLLSIQSIELPISFYNVSSAIKNNKFGFIEGSNTPKIITLDSNNYNVDDIVNDLPSKLNQASVIGATYTISFDNRTLKFTFTSSSTTTFSFDFTEYAPTSKLLGFIPINYNSSDKKIIGSAPANMNSIPFIYLETNFSSRGSIITSSQSDTRTFASGVLLKIPINKDAGDLLTYQPSNKHTLVVQRKRIHNLRFTLKDTNFNTIDLNGISFSLTLTIDFIDFGGEGIYNTTSEDPREENLKLTREDVNEILTQSLIEKGKLATEEQDQRNKLINLLDLNQPK